jgi:hypothetical protein
MKRCIPIMTAAALFAATGAASAQSTPVPSMTAPAAPGSMSAGPSGPDHGMPVGTMGGDGAVYNGKPDLQATISLVTAGGAVGQFSIAQALAALAGADTANAEIAKLTQQYGPDAFASYVAVQNFAVNDAVRLAQAAHVAFPTPNLTGKTLAVRVVDDGLLNGTFYEGYQLDHLVTHAIHEQVMNDIDAKYGTAADANYHRIADQAHFDLAQAVGAKNVQLAAYH